MMVLGQYGAILVGSCLYWVSKGRYCLVLGYIGSVWGGTGGTGSEEGSNG